MPLKTREEREFHLRRGQLVQQGLWLVQAGVTPTILYRVREAQYDPTSPDSVVRVERWLTGDPDPHLFTSEYRREHDHGVPRPFYVRAGDLRVLPKGLRAGTTLRMIGPSVLKLAPPGEQWTTAASYLARSQAQSLLDYIQAPAHTAPMAATPHFTSKSEFPTAPPTAFQLIEHLPAADKSARLTLASDGAFAWARHEKARRRAIKFPIQLVDEIDIPAKSLSFAVVSARHGSLDEAGKVFTPGWSLGCVLRYPQKDMSSTLGEVWGLLSALATQPSESADLLIDSQSAKSGLASLPERTYRELIRLPHHNLWVAAAALQRLRDSMATPTALTTVKVTSHVSEELGGSILNEAADKAATALLEMEGAPSLHEEFLRIGTPDFFLTHSEQHDVPLNEDIRSWILQRHRALAHQQWQDSVTGKRMLQGEPMWSAIEKGTMAFRKHKSRFFERLVVNTLPVATRLNQWSLHADTLISPECRMCQLGRDESQLHLLAECPTLAHIRRSNRAVLSQWMSIRTDHDEEILHPEDLISEEQLREESDLHLTACGAERGHPLLARSRVRAGKRSSSVPSTMLRIDPPREGRFRTRHPYTIRESKYWELQRRWRKRHGRTANRDRFILDLLNTLAHTFEKTVGGAAVNVEKTHWTTRPSLLRILAEEFELDTELYANALNASEFFDKAYSITPGDNSFGLVVLTSDGGCLLIPWGDIRAYANPEYTVEGMKAFFQKITATMRTASPRMRIIAILPDGIKSTGESWNLEKEILKSGGEVVLSFPEETFSFLSDNYWRGTTDDGIRPIPNKVLLASWTSPGTKPVYRDSFFRKIAAWAKYYTKKPRIPPPIESVADATVTYLRRVAGPRQPTPTAKTSEGRVTWNVATMRCCPVCRGDPPDTIETWVVDDAADFPIWGVCPHVDERQLTTLTRERETRRRLRNDHKFDCPHFRVSATHSEHPFNAVMPWRTTYPYLKPYYANMFLGPEPVGASEESPWLLVPPGSDCPRQGFLGPNCGIVDKELARRAAIPPALVQRMVSTILKGALWTYNVRNRLFHDIDPESWETGIDQPDPDDPASLAEHDKRLQERARAARDRGPVSQANQRWLHHRQDDPARMVTQPTVADLGIFGMVDSGDVRCHTAGRRAHRRKGATPEAGSQPTLR